MLIGLVFANGRLWSPTRLGDLVLRAIRAARAGRLFAYFSYITMATVGYGDLTPATGLPRTNAVLEALIGQIFLVVLVARLVTMYTPSFRWGHELHGGAAAAAPGPGEGSGPGPGPGHDEQHGG